MKKQDNQREVALYAYLAGIIDGEGTVRIGADRHIKWNTKYYASVSVGMTDKNVLQLLSDTFGARVRIERVLEGRKPMFRWGTSGNKCVPTILMAILPYLIVKKRQAELVIQFCKEGKHTGFRRNKGIPEEELQRREDFYLKVKELNAVGTPATTKQKDIREDEVIV